MLLSLTRKVIMKSICHIIGNNVLKSLVFFKKESCPLITSICMQNTDGDKLRIPPVHNFLMLIQINKLHWSESSEECFKNNNNDNKLNCCKKLICLEYLIKLSQNLDVEDETVYRRVKYASSRISVQRINWWEMWNKMLFVSFWFWEFWNFQPQKAKLWV